MCLLLQGEFQDLVNTCGDGWQGDGDTTRGCRVTKSGFVTEPAHFLNLLTAKGDEYGIVLEVEDVDIQGFSALGGHTPIMRWDNTPTGAINAHHP